MLFGRDFHVATCHGSDAANVWAVDEVSEEGGAEVAAGMETSQDKVWVALRTVFLRVDFLLDARAAVLIGRLVFRLRVI